MFSIIPENRTGIVPAGLSIAVISDDISETNFPELVLAIDLIESLVNLLNIAPVSTFRIDTHKTIPVNI